MNRCVFECFLVPKKTKKEKVVLGSNHLLRHPLDGYINPLREYSLDLTLDLCTLMQLKLIERKVMYFIINVRVGTMLISRETINYIHT